MYTHKSVVSITFRHLLSIPGVKISGYCSLTTENVIQVKILGLIWLLNSCYEKLNNTIAVNSY